MYFITIYYSKYKMEDNVRIKNAYQKDLFSSFGKLRSYKFEMYLSAPDGFIPLNKYKNSKKLKIHISVFIQNMQIFKL